MTTARKVTGGTVDIAADKAAQISVPVQWGQYRIEITADGLAPSSTTFYAGYYTSEKADTPDMLPVALDRTSVRSGETLQVKIDARFAGKASVQVIGERLYASELIDVPDNGTTVPVRVGSDWGTGAYVVVTHFRPMDIAAKRMPTRSIGLAWFGIDREERTLKVALGARRRDETAPEPEGAGQDRWARRREGLCDRRRRRCRHPQSDALQAAGARDLLLRPEAAVWPDSTTSMAS